MIQICFFLSPIKIFSGPFEGLSQIKNLPMCFVRLDRCSSGPLICCVRYRGSLHHNSSVPRTTTYPTRIKKSRPCFYRRLVFNYWLMVTRSFRPGFSPVIVDIIIQSAWVGSQDWAHMVSPLMINIILINTRSPGFLLAWLMLMEAVGVNSMSGLINRCRMEYHLIFAGSSQAASQLTSPSTVSQPQTTSCESSARGRLF